MEDVQSQIHLNCKLTFPEGLKELMWDISREVLRSQPQDLNKFIADYLSALLMTREHLTVAGRVCDDVCANICHSALDDELRRTGLNETEVQKAKEVIVKHFASDKVTEGNLLLKLMRAADIGEDYLSDVLEAVKKAFLQQNVSTLSERSSDSDLRVDEIERAVRHTLRLYRSARPTEAEYSKAVTDIQVAYRAYGVRRNQCYNTTYAQDCQKTVDAAVNDEDKLERFKSIRFDSADEKTEEILLVKPVTPCVTTVSSTSLAGSHVLLPKYKPYSAYASDKLDELEEIPEKEHTIIDYTLEEPKNDEDKPKEGARSISFYEDIEEVSIEAANDSFSIEEDVMSELESIENDEDDDKVRDLNGQPSILEHE